MRGRAQGQDASAAARIRRIQFELSAEAPTVHELLHRMGPASVGLILLLLGGLALVPGIAPVFGAGLIVVSLGLVVGRGELWLPGWLRRRPIPRAKLDAAIARLAPRLVQLERWTARRGKHLLGGTILRIAGLAVAMNGLLILLPIPFGNGAPALAVLVLALGLTAGDGLAVLTGLVISLGAMMFDAALIVFGYRAAIGLIGLIW